MTLILTLRLDPASQAHFESLRQKHFPPARNQIPAHLTLFHQLPDSVDVTESLQQLAQHTQAFPVAVTGLRSLGKGVVYSLASPSLQHLHQLLAASFKEHLTPQDKQRFMPHIVVQNKATPEQARTLLTTLQHEFAPMTVQACGLDLWEYLGGPWKHRQTFTFSA